MRAADIMTRNVISVQPETTILQAAHLMLEHRISGLPVLDSNRHVVGIVTGGDFLRRVETGTQRQRPRWVQFFLGPGRLAEEYVRTSSRKVDDVIVRNGTVELWGTLSMRESVGLSSSPPKTCVVSTVCATTLFTWSRSPA